MGLVVSLRIPSTWGSGESKVTWTVQWNVVYIFRLKV